MNPPNRSWLRLLVPSAAAALVACANPAAFEAGPFSVPENSGAGTQVGALPDPQTLSYRITGGNTGAAFLVDSGGALKVASPTAIDFEAKPSFTLQVEATAEGGATATSDVEIHVLNVNEAPALAAAILFVPLDATNGTQVGDLSDSASDPDTGQTFTFTVTGGTGQALFAVAPTTGLVTVVDAPNLGDGPWTLTVQVADSGSPALSASAGITLARAGSAVAVADNVTGATGTPIVLELLANDVLGTPAATVVGFGGGALGGTSTAFSAGTSRPLAGGSVQVSASGQLTLTPTQAGTFTFFYRLENTNSTSDAQVTLRICPNLPVGGVYVGPAVSELCLQGGASGAEYTLSPVNVSAEASAALSVTATGIIPVVGAPTPILLPASALASSPTEDFEARLRRMERTDLSWTARPVGERLPRAAIIPGVPAVGSTMTINANGNSACGSPSNRTGQVVAVSAHAILMADQANPANGFSASDYTDVANEFESVVHATVTGAFGNPTDIDTNSRVILFFTSAVNALTPAGSSSLVGGFFFARDVVTSGCAGSNLGEMFYLLVPDPTGSINGNVRTVPFVKGKINAIVAHEFQHLINASRRIHINGASSLEDTWLDEGLAHISEELAFFAASGLAPKQNLDILDLTPAPALAAFSQYAESNFSRYRTWLVSPHTNGLFQDDDDVETRGAAWAFLRYVADRCCGNQSTLWSTLANSTATGMTNVTAALGTDPNPWIRDFIAATYADDATSGVPALFTQPSWNFRDIYTGLNYGGPQQYPLEPRDPSNGAAETFTLTAGGGAAFLRMGVASNQQATVTTTVGGSAPPSTVLWSVFRRK